MRLEMIMMVDIMIIERIVVEVNMKVIVEWKIMMRLMWWKWRL